MTERFHGSPLKAVPCDLCGSSRQQTMMTLTDLIGKSTQQVFRLARCRICGLIFLNPRPYDWDLHRYYPEEYAPFARSRLGSLARDWLHHRSVRELASIVGYPRRVLDIGCGTGELLSQIRRTGNPNVTGIEPSSQASAIARNERHLEVHTGTLHDFRFPSNSFDTVLMSHVLEHLPSPSTTMAEVTRILKPGGVVIIWVPNARSWAARVFGRYWMGWDVPRHLYSFTPSTLYRLMNKTGLKLEQTLHEKHAIEWSWGIRLWAADRWKSQSVDRALSVMHPILSLALTPISALAGHLGRAGRIRVIARKS